MDGPVLVGMAALGAAIAAALAVRRLAWLTRVESWSMWPGLRPGALRLTARLRPSVPVHRGDVVVVRSHELGRRIVKRVVGLPGEVVDVAPNGVRIDGRNLPEPYVAAHGGRTGRFTVPAGHYLVLGDNRRASDDSRRWREPFVPRAAVEGRLVSSIPCPRGTQGWGSIVTASARPAPPAG